MKKTDKSTGYNAKAGPVHGNVAKPAKLRDIPPHLPSLTKHVHGLPPPIKVRVTDGLGAPAPAPTQGVNYGSRARKGKGQSNQS